ncbi:MAG TPA: dihydrolipoamide acetyltransferase family protein [Gemmataceae bacterium]|jgi:2-oxoisovalerate dehydrogenase E2 component (dihydrolipoyl transacylase)|nr:dihydrolipoamide acetyltransferase family protein [Gemmataceae bacterium]
MDFALPELGEGVYEAELVRWLVKPGDAVKPGQSLLEVMTDKATMEVPAPFGGTVTSVTGEPGGKIKVGSPILTFQPAGAKAELVAPVVAKPAAAMAVGAAPAAARNGSNGEPATAVAAPSVRHLARKLGIDLGRVQGSGPAGRILIDDLTPHISKPSEPLAASPPAAPAADYGRPGTKIKLAGLRRKIAEHLVDAKRRIPHYSYIDECDVTELVRLRQSLRDPCAKIGIRLTYLPFFVKAVAAALKEVPVVNSSLDEAREEIVLHDRYHIGVAVATPNGLIVPVVRDADAKDLFAVATEIDRLGADARAGKSKLDDVRGGTFTVTSIGNVGGVISTPIINHPEVGIMGVGKVVRRPVYDDHGALRPADLVYLSFSFDHRVLDGAVGAAFGNAVKKHLENPAAVLVPPRK